MAKHSRATVYLKPEVMFILGKMGEQKISGRVARVISRYGDIVNGVDLDTLFTAPELAAISTIVRESEFKPGLPLEPGVRIRIEDAPEKSFRGISKKTIIEKVKALSRPELVALVERVRRLSGSED